MTNDSKSFKEWFWAFFSKRGWIFILLLFVGMFYLGNKDPGLLVRLVAFFSAVIGILMLLYGVRTRRLQRESLSWFPVQGRVLGSEVEIETSTSNVGSQHDTYTSYYPRVTYAYEYGGESYESRRIIVANINWPKKEAEAAVARYPVNSEVTVWVDPLHPKMAVLEPGMEGKSQKYIMVFLVGMFFLLCALVFWLVQLFFQS
jgi:hypothetical protein